MILLYWNMQFIVMMIEVQLFSVLVRIVQCIRYSVVPFILQLIYFLYYNNLKTIHLKPWDFLNRIGFSKIRNYIAQCERQKLFYLWIAFFILSFLSRQWTVNNMKLIYCHLKLTTNTIIDKLLFRLKKLFGFIHKN